MALLSDKLDKLCDLYYRQKSFMVGSTMKWLIKETQDGELFILSVTPSNLFPENIVQACLQQQQSYFVTVVKEPKYVKVINSTMQSMAMNVTESSGLTDWTDASAAVSYEAVKPKYVDSTNVLEEHSKNFREEIIFQQM
ncbi:uncharacterized protein DEA37_0000121 [Paragonimus westermani]|uniref:Uncharacterized protein n=1 Tax=Paragonimus westermani TaxID=34504 RepID=A0A5J4NX07_9TREM|nr:uncharacterized protein DEA37_0000121 [Paragonimus westermani]